MTNIKFFQPSSETKRCDLFCERSRKKKQAKLEIQSSLNLISLDVSFVVVFFLQDIIGSIFLRSLSTGS